MRRICRQNRSSKLRTPTLSCQSLFQQRTIKVGRYIGIENNNVIKKIRGSTVARKNIQLVNQPRHRSSFLRRIINK